MPRSPRRSAKKKTTPTTAAKGKYGTDNAAPGRSIPKPSKIIKSAKGATPSEQKKQKMTAGLSAHVRVETAETARQDREDIVIECERPAKPVSKRAPVTKADNTAKHTSGAPRSEGVLLPTPDTEDSEDELKDLQYFPHTSLSTTPAEHVRSDADFTECLCTLRNAVAAFATAHFCFTIPEAVQADTLAKIAVTATPELIRYAGFIAVGGPNGRAGWEEIFVQKNERSALAFGLLGHALKEHCFMYTPTSAPVATDQKAERSSLSCTQISTSLRSRKTSSPPGLGC
ncbi:hypothetical protein B0A49_00607 [Cryomyces minteri]|uniref:Uncharacterized protein n=1 Tax=Cryomyces minteri TaxID=331657 RepID=A0A4U0Y075_9PEZI|nr:hypothetical protein B0A49_00607 [Cryomyces minteri]